MIRRAAIIAAAAALLPGCNNSPAVIAPPRVNQGGRALSIAVRSDNERRMVVASETGGLFRTFDGGISWQHLDLPNYKTIDVVKSVVAARGEVPFAPPRTPMVFVVNAGKTGLPSAVESNQPVRVIGTSFLPASRSAQPVRILFDGVVVAEAVQVRADGSFSIDIPVHHSPGEMIVTVEQRDGHRVTIEASSIDVVSGDRPDSTRAAANSGSTIQ